MALTQRLEDLIWKHKAKYETWTIGTEATGLEVGDNETVIIIGFDYFQYIDPEEAVQGDYGNFLRRLNKQITFSSKDRRYNFLYRGHQQIDNETTRGQVVLPSTSPYKFDCYLVFEDNISCAIANVASPDNWAGLTFAPAPTESEQKRTPLSFGNANTPSIATLQRLVVNGVAEIRSFKATPGGLGAPGTQTYHQFQVPFDFNAAAFPPQPFDWGVFTYPCLTVHLVRINDRLEGKFL